MKQYKHFLIIYNYNQIINMSDHKSLLHDDDIIKSEDGLIWNPYNPLNVQIELSQVQFILSKYGLPPIINNFNLYKRAFVHRSYTKRPQYENAAQNITIVEKPPDCVALSTKCNERMEFLGDGVLELAAKFFLYRNFPKEDEGFMTDKKIAMVKNEAIGKIVLEMGLHKWFIISRNAEEKGLRNNIKKLGCLFEAFVGAIFLDYNKIDVADNDDWFKKIFITGPGWQFAQLFLENVFEKHVDRIALVMNNDNYKNLLQVAIQKEFKVTPDYLEISHDVENGYHMGVYLCLGQQIYNVSHADAIHVDKLKTFSAIHDYVQQHGKIFMFLGEGIHKIKKKAEQIACEETLVLLKKYDNIKT
jgi:dsRNA-specific ribonuclease